MPSPVKMAKSMEALHVAKLSDKAILPTKVVKLCQVTEG